MEAAEEYYNFLVVFGKKSTWNLLTLNQLLTFVSSLFIFSNKTLMSLCEKKRFVPSANTIGISTFEAWCKLFTYNRNNKGLKRDPWGIRHVTGSFLVESFWISRMILDKSRKTARVNSFFSKNWSVRYLKTLLYIILSSIFDSHGSANMVQ